MDKYIRKIGTISLIVSILLIVLSIFMITRTQETIVVAMVLFGYILVCEGLFHLSSYFQIEGPYRYFSYELAQAILDIILGFIVVSHAADFVAVFPIVFGIWVILEGIFQLQVSLNIRGIRGVPWGLAFTASLVSIALGFAMIFYPNKSFDVIVKLMGAVLMFTQLLSIYNDIYFLTVFRDGNDNNTIEVNIKTKKK